MVVEVIVRDFQVTEGIPLGVFEAHHQEEELLQDTEAEEVGPGLHHGVHPTEVGVTAAAVHQLSHIDLVPLHGLRGGDHLLGAGAHQNQGHPWTPNLLGGQAKTGQSHHLEARMGRRAWSLMEMVLLILANGEKHSSGGSQGANVIFHRLEACIFMMEL